MSSQSGDPEFSNTAESEDNRSKSPGDDNNSNADADTSNAEKGSEKGSKDNKDGGNSQSKDVCREFVRGFCFRGSSCKFRHPAPSEMNDLGHRGPQFCHDYQNRYCHRPSCRYTHATKDEEAEYHRTGVLPLRVLRLQFGDPDIPVCRDFLSGKCSRGKDCKFRHLSEREVEQEKRNLEFYAKSGGVPPEMGGPAPLFGNGSGFPPAARMGMMNPGGRFPGDGNPNELKRRRMGDGFPGMPGDLFFNPEMPDPSSAMFRNKQLEEENGALLRKIDDLKRQIQQLNDTNDELLEQNARLRSQLQKALATSGPLPVPAPMPLSGGAQQGGMNVGNGANMFSMVAQQQHQQQQPSSYLKRDPYSSDGYDFR